MTSYSYSYSLVAFLEIISPPLIGDCLVHLINYYLVMCVTHTHAHTHIFNVRSSTPQFRIVTRAENLSLFLTITCLFLASINPAGRLDLKLLRITLGYKWPHKSYHFSNICLREESEMGNSESLLRPQIPQGHLRLVNLLWSPNYF